MEAHCPLWAAPKGLWEGPSAVATWQGSATVLGRVQAPFFIDSFRMWSEIVWDTEITTN